MPDVFTSIHGISPLTASSLQEAGILSYEKLAAMTPEEVVERIGTSSGISAEIIAKEDWIGQAAKLAEKSQSTISDPEKKDSEASLHATNYMVEVFLDGSNKVHRTRVYHVQSDEGEAWDYWDEGRLLTFFKRRPELRLAKLLQAAKNAPPAKSKQTEEIKTAKINAKSSAATSPSSAITVATGSKVDAVKRAIGMPRLEKLEIIPEGFRSQCRSFDHRQTFNVRLFLDLVDMKHSGQEPFNYTVAVMAKRIGGDPQQYFIKDQGTITSHNNATLNLKWSSLPQGTYRITAALTLSPRYTDAEQQPDLTASLEGGLFEVH